VIYCLSCDRVVPLRTIVILIKPQPDFNYEVTYPASFLAKCIGDQLSKSLPANQIKFAC